MITLQDEWWKGTTQAIGTPHDLPCKGCKHLTQEHEITRAFIWSAGRIIGRKSTAHCRRCECQRETYVELCESGAERDFWAIASTGPGFEGFGRIELSKEELGAFLKTPLSSRPRD